MNDETKLCRYPLRIWWRILLIIQIFFLLSLIGVIASPFWVYTIIDYSYYAMSDYDSSKSGYFDGGSFVGSVDSCLFGCTGSYKSQWTDWCEIHDTLVSQETPCIFTCMDQLVTKSLCNTFYTLQQPFAVSLALELCPIVGVIFWIAALYLYLIKDDRWLYGSYAIAAVSCCCHYAAIIAWICIASTYVTNNCGYFPEDGSGIALCISDAIKLGLALMILFPIAIVFYIVITCMAQGKKKNNVYGGPPEKG